MKNQKAIIIGTGKLAEYVYMALTHDSLYEVEAFSVEAAFNGHSNTLFGLQIITLESLLESHPPGQFHVFIAVGNNALRERLFKKVKAMGFTCLSYLSSRAVLWPDLVCGENVLVTELSGVQPFVTIGDNSILFGARVGHHSVIGNHTLISGCTLAGNVKVGDSTFIGLNVAVKENINIGEANIIGMGSIIVNDTSNGEVYLNAPTKRRDMPTNVKIKFSEKFL
ncbi:hypothetical protein TH61_10620 [Rufibacter sp. DG15C]|uniref:acetyltransferase n=1 Tax=Rufibacter sp. DG15C TaxID=1379909 RepID=UPI00078D4295|nr:acetyltransferase [Rufibacter sp. DG15C]AMM51536.1 hypothetical protein TH61_10620 [Rufibacter sp. DG15C]